VNRTAIGAGAGAVLALVWVVLGGWAMIAVVVLAAVGGAIGFVLDRPGALNELLERITNR
jgi:uncharacterized membrane protein